MGGAALGVTAATTAGTALAAPAAKETTPASNRIIDFHAHLVPEGAPNPAIPPQMKDLNGLYREQKAAGVDTTVISNPLFSPTSETPSLEFVRAWNAWAGETSKRSAGRIIALAYAYPWAGREYVKEVERSLKQDGCAGIMVNSSSRGEYLDSPKNVPLYELATELDVPIFVHPPYAGMSGGNMDEFRLHEMVGRPCDTTLTMARLILFGVLERYPTLNRRRPCGRRHSYAARPPRLRIRA